MPYYWCHKSVNDQTLLCFLTIHSAIRRSQLKKDPLLSLSVYHCYTEQRVAICCTLPTSSKSCFMWRLSWGSLARGSGGSNSPVKSSQLSRTTREGKVSYLASGRSQKTISSKPAMVVRRPMPLIIHHSSSDPLGHLHRLSQTLSPLRYQGWNPEWVFHHWATYPHPFPATIHVIHTHYI